VGVRGEDDRVESLSADRDVVVVAVRPVTGARRPDRVAERLGGPAHVLARPAADVRRRGASIPWPETLLR
jgi:hypothetical protein